MAAHLGPAPPAPLSAQALAEMNAAALAPLFATAPLMQAQPQGSLQGLPQLHLPPGVKVCENCGTTTTPLWRKDRASGMMMCNACGIFFKHHQKHRPVELTLQPNRGGQHPPAAPPAAAPMSRPAHSAEDSEAEEAGLPGTGGLHTAGWQPTRSRRRLLPTANQTESDYSEQSDEDPEERRRSLRPRRARQAAEEYLHELAAGTAGAAVAAMAVEVGVAAGVEEDEAPDAGAHESDGASELSSVQLLDEAAAERQRVDLINRLVKEALTADFDGAIEGLKSLKQARITDPATGQSFGLVRLYADPGEPPVAAVVHKPARPGKAASHHRGGSTASGKPVQTCFNCNTTSTPLWRKERETGRMYCNACGIFKKTHGIERPLGTSRFKQFSSSHKGGRGGGKRGRGGGAKAGKRGGAKAGSPGLAADSDSEPESHTEMSISEAEEAEEGQGSMHQRPRRRSLGSQGAVPGAASAEPPVPAPAAAAAAAAAGEEARRTTSGRTVRVPCTRLGDAAGATSPEVAAELAAAESAEKAECEVAEAVRRQQLPTLPPHISLFKSAPVAAPAGAAPAAAAGLPGGGGAAAAALLLQLPPMPGAAPPAAQATLSACSDVSAYSQPPLPAGSVPGGMAAGLPSYGVPLPGLMPVGSSADAGGRSLPSLAPASASCWPAQQHWAAPLPPRHMAAPPAVGVAALPLPLPEVPFHR